jgi:hypothetical protein
LVALTYCSQVARAIGVAGSSVGPPSKLSSI